MEGNSIKSFENLCKIFETNIKLNRVKGISPDEKVLSNYGKYTKKIDDIYNSVFVKELESLIEPKKTLEQEEKRLEKLISLLEGRMDKRQILEDKYYEMTGNYPESFQPIVSNAELDEKRERLRLISKYLDTKKEIANITDDIGKLRNELSEEEAKKNKYLNKNKIMEDELYSLFIGTIKNDSFYDDLNEEELNQKREEVSSKAEEAKETFDVTLDSIKSLTDNGIEDDYSTYIDDAAKNYYEWQNRELVLKIYELVVVLDDNFEEMTKKRVKIRDLMLERISLKEKLKIDSLDEFFEFEKTLDNQISSLIDEKKVLENINNYNSRITYKEERLSELEEENNSVEILAILREYGLVEMYENEEEEILDEVSEKDEDDTSISEIVLEQEKEDNIEKESSSEVQLAKFIDPYTIIEIKDYPKTLNVGLAKLKGASVREKVNKKLNPEMFKKNIDDLIMIDDNKQEENIKVDEKKLNTDFSFKEEKAVAPLFNITDEEENKDLEIDKETKEEVAVPLNELEKEDNLNVSHSLNIDNENEKAEEKKVLEEETVTQDKEQNSSLKTDDKIEHKENIEEKKNINLSDTIPVWDIPKEDTKNESDAILSVMDIQPFDKSSNNDDKISIGSEPVKEDTNNFWIPVSESKLEASEFPSIDIPIKDSAVEKNEFGFPEIGGA